MPDLTTQNFTTQAGAQFHLYAFTIPANSTYQFNVSVVPKSWVAALPGLRDATRVDVWPGQDVPADALRLYAESTLRFPSVDSQFVSFRNYSANPVLVHLYALGDDEKLSGNLWAPNSGAADQTTVPLVTAGTISPSGSQAYLTFTLGYPWAYLEVSCSTTYSIFAVGKSAASAAAYHFQVSDGGALISRSTIAAGANYAIRFRCAGLDQVGVSVANGDAGVAATVTARVVLVRE